MLPLRRGMGEMLRYRCGSSSSASSSRCSWAIVSILYPCGKSLAGSAHASCLTRQEPQVLSRFGNLNAPNGVASAQPNPLRDGAVLLLRLRKLLLGTERLVALNSEGLVSDAFFECSSGLSSQDRIIGSPRQWQHRPGVDGENSVSSTRRMIPWSWLTSGSSHNVPAS